MKLCTAENMIKFSLSVAFTSPKRSLSIFRGWNARVAWNKFKRISEYLGQLKKKCSASSIALSLQLQTGLGQRWLLNKSWFKMLQLLRMRYFVWITIMIIIIINNIIIIFIVFIWSSRCQQRTDLSSTPKTGIMTYSKSIKLFFHIFIYYYFFVKSWIYIVYIIIQLKYGNTDHNQNRFNWW